MQSSVTIVAYLALFMSVGLAFVFAILLMGRFFRPASPTAEKLETYECGERAVGSSFVQFDLRFYVVALIFLVFDVEVAFLFPWATVFGKSVNMTHDRLQVVAPDQGDAVALTDDARQLYRELGVRHPAVPQTIPETLASRWAVEPAGAGRGLEEFVIQEGSRQLAYLALAAAGIFFFILLVGFAYEWKTGSLDWVWAAIEERKEPHGQTTLE